MIVERPIRNAVKVETLTRSESPFILGNGILGYTRLAAAGVPQDWREWTGEVSRISIRRGGRIEGVTIQNAPGLLTLTIRDVELDRFSPQLYREQPIRVHHLGDTETPLFTGWIRDVEQHYMPIRNNRTDPSTFVTITAVDAVARHDETTRYGAIPAAAGETFAARIARLAISATAPITGPTDPYNDAWGNPILLGRTVYESSLSNHLTLAVNTVGAMWYVDATGVTRFQPREYDAANAVEFSNGWEPAPDALSAVAYTPAPSTESGYNTVTARNKDAAIDPDSGGWVDAETLHDLIPGYISLLGKQEAILDTNAVDPGQIPAVDWVRPNMFGWGSLLSGIRWNAQQDLSRIPDLDLGVSIAAEAFTASATPWNKYLVIGIEHTITPTRWMVDLTVLGAD